MKKLFLILFLGIFARTLNAQNIAKYEVVSMNVVATVAATPDVVEYPSYRASYTLGKKGGSIEVFSPRSDNAEVKLDDPPIQPDRRLRGHAQGVVSAGASFEQRPTGRQGNRGRGERRWSYEPRRRLPPDPTGASR